MSAASLKLSKTEFDILEILTEWVLPEEGDFPDHLKNWSGDLEYELSIMDDDEKSAEVEAEMAAHAVEYDDIVEACLTQNIGFLDVEVSDRWNGDDEPILSEQIKPQSPVGKALKRMEKSGLLELRADGEGNFAGCSIDFEACGNSVQAYQQAFGERS